MGLTPQGSISVCWASTCPLGEELTVCVKGPGTEQELGGNAAGLRKVKLTKGWEVNKETRREKKWKSEMQALIVTLFRNSVFLCSPGKEQGLENIICATF